MPAYICTYPENLMKISPLHFEIIGLEGDVKNKESNISKTWAIWRRDFSVYNRKSCKLTAHSVFVQNIQVVA